MPIRAVVFDIGGVLEYTPRTGWVAQWGQRLRLTPGELDERVMDLWEGGSLGTMSLKDVEQGIAERLGLDQAQLAAFMGDLWDEYLGTPNTELMAYFASLRPRYQTAIISNSFVGAREQEQARYHFAEMCDLIVYSHEEGVAKPEPRIFQLTCERLGIQPAEMLFLDDVEGHVAAARELGIAGIVFKDNAQAIADIQRALEDHAS